MLADAHRNAAEDIEAAIASLVASPRATRLIIEGAWGAAFHWIAFGCDTKHGKHQESHARLGTFLRSLGKYLPPTTGNALIKCVRAAGTAARPTLPLNVPR
jgi:hypothetical protein